MGDCISITVEVSLAGRRALRRLCASTSVAALAACLGACASETSFDSPESAARIRAIHEAAAADDAASVPKLIALLDSDDAAVRLLSIRTLEKITGETMKYDFAAPDYERADAVRRWREWYARSDAGKNTSAGAPSVSDRDRTLGRAHPGESSEHP